MKDTIQAQAVGVVLAERNRQDQQWGGPEHDDTHDFEYWCGAIRERVRERDEGELEMLDTAAEAKLLIQTAALALAALESLCRQEVDNILRYAQ